MAYFPMPRLDVEKDTEEYIDSLASASRDNLNIYLSRKDDTGKHAIGFAFQFLMELVEILDKQGE